MTLYYVKRGLFKLLTETSDAFAFEKRSNDTLTLNYLREAVIRRQKLVAIRRNFFLIKITLLIGCYAIRQENLYVMTLDQYRNMLLILQCAKMKYFCWNNARIKILKATVETILDNSELRSLLTFC